MAPPWTGSDHTYHAITKQLRTQTDTPVLRRISSMLLAKVDLNPPRKTPMSVVAVEVRMPGRILVWSGGMHGCFGPGSGTNTGKPGI